MADKKTGYEQAAEAQAKQTSGSPAKETEPIKLKVTKKAPRKVGDDLRAMSQIDSILEKFSPEVARRILRQCQERMDEQMVCNKRQCCTDPRREPGGDLYTPPIPGLDDRDHG